MPSDSKSKGNPRGGVTDDPLVWIDCEMTGLDPDAEVILEIYCILTTGNMELIDEEGYHAIIHCPAERLEQMDDWCTKTHAGSGLTAAVLASTTTPSDAADGLYNYITKFIPERKKALLAGNSVYADRGFLRQEPYTKVMKHLHHRILDVSAIKEAARRWCSAEILAGVPVKKAHHKARDDILESIEEAKYYRDAIFKQSS
ncbi:Phosphatidylinositol 3,4,5-trisphosphate-dependent Rac exchanger 2 protein [Lecanicillium sp. MT-2017a]|nr:Phosphatidylinositol 3,4,5-trisphosphate-dependent Rac exchanger 2 protein [Lecanicillium sp. MT-2017a]